MICINQPALHYLTATNSAANEINHQNLKRLPAERQRFKAKIVGDFPAGGYPTGELEVFAFLEAPQVDESLLAELSRDGELR